MKNRLETLVNIATLAACLAVCGAGLSYVLSNRAPRVSDVNSGADATERPKVRAGDQLTLPAASAGRPSVILYVSPTCHFCTESMAFYRRLTETPAISSGAVQLLAASSVDPSAVKAYLGAHGVEPRGFVNGADVGINTRATPTLLLVNARGVISSSWTGLLFRSQEQEVEQALAALGNLPQ